MVKNARLLVAAFLAALVCAGNVECSSKRDRELTRKSPPLYGTPSPAPSPPVYTSPAPLPTTPPATNPPSTTPPTCTPTVTTKTDIADGCCNSTVTTKVGDPDPKNPNAPLPLITTIVEKCCTVNTTVITYTPCTPTPCTNTSTVDLALVIDSSGSMAQSDPSNLRLTAASNLVNKLQPGDRAAVIDFDDFAVLRQSLTADKPKLLAALATLNSAGGTNIQAGVQAGIDALKGSKSPVLLLLTDGMSTWNPGALSTVMKNANPPIVAYTVGLFPAGGGAMLDVDKLKQLATQTGGTYSEAKTDQDLIAIFNMLTRTIICPPSP